MQFSFSITDLKKSVPGAKELAALDGDALIAKLREVLGDAARDADVTVEGEVVTVRPHPVTASNSEEAKRLTGKAAARAQRGEYEKAANIYRRVLELDPHRQDSRRELAMVLVEMGQTSEAVDTLLDVLKVDPRDPQALIILGNHYARVERDLPTAIRFLERAAEIAPEDALVQNSLGAVLFEQKKPQEALRHFDRALELNPKFASALYGKSMLLTHEGRFPAALQCLRSIFEQADVSDARNRPMLKVARESYLKVTNIVANDRADDTFKLSESLKAQVAAESGFPLKIEPKELPGTLCATTQMAWKHRRDYHLVSLQAQLPAEMVKHHILSHECWHVLLESRARKAGVNRWFASDDAGIATAVDSMTSDIRKIARATRHDETELRKLAARLIRDGLSLLYNGPLDILIEGHLAENEIMREAQVCSLFLQMHNAASMGLDKSDRSVVPVPLLRMNDGINGAVALFVDELTSGASAFFSRYGETGNAKIAREIHAICTVPVQSAGGEFGLIDQVAELLGATSWYYWKEDPGAFEILEKLTASDEGGITNPALLKRKSSEAMPFLLAALRRFDRMDAEAIKRLTLEAALLGQEGIDYADGAKRHRLKSLPEDLLSGLEVMCFLYAGLKRIAPTEADTGFDLNDEFAMALELYHAEKER